MRVLHITTGIEAGAGSGAYLLHSALRRKGVDSRVLTFFPSQIGDASLSAVCTSAKSRLLRFLFTQLDMAPRRLFPRRRDELFSCGLFGFDINRLPGVAEADIIHLHWINHGMIRVSSLCNAAKPFVWTMRDMWPFTGGCHHAFDCQRYKDACGCCPHLRSRLAYDPSRCVLRNKARYYPNIRMQTVAISTWLKECADQSQVMSAMPTKIIFNGIDLDIFRPENRLAARRTLGLPETAEIILYGATQITSAYKGFNYIKAALPELQQTNRHFVFFGSCDTKELESLGVPYTAFGYLDEVSKLRAIYSAADVFVAPSVAEAFGKTLVESLACGTPVVCFDLGGPRDIVIHRETGWRAKALDSHDLAEGVNWVLREATSRDFRATCRQHVQANFDINGVIVRQYIDLYRSVLGEIAS